MTVRVAYLSSGKLYLQEPDQPATEITSAFGESVVQRTLEVHQRADWKRKGRGAQFMSGGMLWGADQGDPRAVRVHITAVTRGAKPDELWYALDTDAAGGLFEYRPPLAERRIFHKEHFRVRDLDRHPDQPSTAFTLYAPNGTAHIAVMDGDGPFFEEVTEGDSIEEAPAWAPGRGRTLVFQSAGVGRNAQGFAIGVGPIAIQEIDLTNRTLKTIWEDSAYDFLLPHLDAQGNLYCIRRPFEAQGQSRRSIGQGLKDSVLFPWRMIEAIFQFFNFFSMTFNKKPLTTAGGPKVEGADAQTVLLRGRLLDVQRALREKGQDADAPALVPKSWELIRRSPEGQVTVLAQRVAAYDLGTDGTIVTTNGSAIQCLDAAGRSLRVGRGRLIEHLILLK